ncbi:AAA family ATPase [Tolypothrix sp. PCC 7910]|uniref:trifunctional serine/threonine-protein kinase/ATP-binding protein/sensor histidine kinase n=1 Tax=Tolypothrix sp. PCC 7910 TaxID=2099387 RepID=UPI00142799D7|nr:ATP-binding sensor histidine kinase [Tolypothrix sp. PCC 7910]QIR37757.1 AAA family ATPase [Tolypothrix sp. PCC 7910]
MVSTQVIIPGYRISEEIYNGSRTLVYRGYREADHQPVAIKLLKNPYPSFSELVQFRNQYTIAKNLPSPLVVQTYSLEPYQNGYALVMEDFGGIALNLWWDRGEAVGCLLEFLKIAIALCNILDVLYRHRIIHKDIKPANILVNPETHEIRLIDFSIASLLPRESQTVVSPNILEGTLGYLSPEQTGRMNRGIDYRTDFYSLGVTFYELLTGELPFQSNDMMEMVHCHIAQQPNQFKIQNSKFKNGELIPQVLSDIVMKLMAKNAEERYQSALGLKYDLEKCLEQLKITGKIDSFPIAQRDVCDRFIIPDKLYGRQTEVEALLNAFERVSKGNTEMILVAGFSGIGKTAVVNEIHKPIVRQRGYFIKGKFDQFNRNIPFSAFVQALRDLMGQLLSESDAQLQIWKNQILQALGDNAQVIVDVIPELEQIIGVQPAVAQLGGNAEQNRFNLLFQKFIATFTIKKHPLVIFIDDLQWADSASLKLIELLIGDNNHGYLLLIGAYRDNEVFPAHPLMETLNEIGKNQTYRISHTIALTPLKISQINQLIADTLSCSPEKALYLTKLVYQKTRGNPFFNHQFLKALYEDGLISFNLEKGYWQCDISEVNTLSLTDNVVELMAIQLQKLPQPTQNALKLAACIGNSFDLGTLAIVYQKSQVETAVDLWPALQAGLILPKNEVYKLFQDHGNHAESQILSSYHFQNPNYKFLHDRVQQAAYYLIPEVEKQSTHLKIGRLLLLNTPIAEQEEKIFEIVNQLNCGSAIITQPDERQQLAQLNLRVGCKAKESTAYSAAVYYFNQGIQLLTTNSWENAYELTRSLHEEAAESAFLNKEFHQMESLIQIVLQQATSLLDQAKVNEIKLHAYQVQGQQLQAIATGREILQELGVNLPESVTPIDIQQQVENTLATLAGRNILDLVQLPVMKDTKALVALRIMNSIVPSIHQAAPYLFPIIACEEVSLSLKYGNAPLSAPGYADFGIVVNTVLNKLEEGYQFGQLALLIVDLFQAKSVESMTTMKVAAFNEYNQHHVSQAISLLQQSYTIGLETGDFVHVLVSMFFKLFYTYLSGVGILENLLEDIRVYKSNFANSNNFLNWSNILAQTTNNLIINHNNPDYLIGEYCNEKEILLTLQQENDELALHVFFLNKLMLAYLFKNIPEAVKNADQGEHYLKGGAGLLSVPVFYFYASLSWLAAYPMAEPSTQAQLLLRVNENQHKLQLQAQFAPMNFQHKYDLVSAEKHRVLGQKAEAIEYYDRAIALAKENHYLQEAALANELTAQFYLEWGKHKLAQVYMQEAYYCYAHWGAKTKIYDLEKRYPDLLQPILQVQSHHLLLSETYISTIDASSYLHQTIQTTRSSSSSSISKNLDFGTIFKASQALSSEIELEKLLNTLMEVLMTNAGAKKAVLLAIRDGNWLIEAIATTNEGTNQQTVPLEISQAIPETLINYVKRSGKTVVLDDATSQTDFIADPYLMQQQPKSVMCTPIWHQGKLIGLLYLENQLTIAAFTRDRTEVIQLLCTQAAISLENAHLYQQSQDYAQKLEQMLKQLKHTQLQMVQNEKMASLGNLVAGVAHEINNPVGFLKGSLNNTEQYIQDLLTHLQLLQENNPILSPAAIDHAEEIDLEFLKADLPKLVGSMKVASERIKDISTSLRTFSRADTAEKVACNLHEGIESTILILKYRLKASEKRPAIQVIKEYGNLPQVKCFLGQLNQVFMNILGNAIDALDTVSEGHSFADLEAYPQQITIRTDISDDGRIAIIGIQDNGPGMPESIRDRIFDHLFTTKEVGKGTGLGLAIARQIVEQTHNGRLSCNSVLGEGTEFVIEIPV